ncbi:MAG: hypothetical protein ACYC92_12605, partial [Candidatus Acidiferrales bacterium]
MAIAVPIITPAPWTRLKPQLISIYLLQRHFSAPRSLWYENGGSRVMGGNNEKANGDLCDGA